MPIHNLASGEIAAHNKQLAANTADTVQFADDVTLLRITNLDAVALIYITIDGTNPAVAGGKSRLVPAGSARTISAPGGDPPAVKLISAGNPVYSVEAI